MRERSVSKFWILVFVLGLCLWLVHIDRPVDLPIWHEFDYASIARNFVREGNNILYPRIDWRGDGPGYTEMELPIIPWTVAQLYRVFGIHEIIGRILSLIFTLLALAIFRRLARKLLPERAALIAGFFFVTGALVTQIATALQPESLMLLLYLLAVYYFLDWYETGKRLAYGLAVASFASAMLVKIPAAHLGIFFFLWALHRDGSKVFRKVSLYVFAMLAFIPVTFWYVHAAGLWHEFHNSMGVANEDHWFGLDLLRRQKVIANLIGMDLLLVCGGGAAVLGLAAFIKSRFRSTVNVVAAYWCVAILIYLFVIMRTASAYWAAYYHVILVPPIALLCGSVLDQLQLSKPAEWRRCLAAMLGTSLILIAGVSFLSHRNLDHLPGLFQQLGGGGAALPVLTVLTPLSIAVTVLILWLGRLVSGTPEPSSTTVNGGFKILIASACFTYFFVNGQFISGLWKTFGTRTVDYRSAQSIRSKMDQTSLIVASGGICSDPDGHRVASNAPEMFFWLDHKGFSTCQGHESITQLRAFERRGARYFVADRLSLSLQPGFEEDLRRSFPMLADCNSVLLFRLR